MECSLLSINYKKRMLKLRLARVGKKKKPVYRLVVSEHTKDMYGNHLEILGQYNPHTKEAVLKNDRIEHWLKVGAQPSETVENLLVKEGLIKNGKKAKAVSISKKRKTKIEGKKAEASSTTKASEDKEVPADVSSETSVKDEEVKEETKEDATEEAKEDPSTVAQDEDKK